MPNRHNRRAFIASRSAYPAAPWQEERRRSRRNGWTLMAVNAAALAALFGYAFAHDSAIRAERIEAASRSAEAPKASNRPARIEGPADGGAAPIMAAIAGELRAAGCTVRVDSSHSYEVESC